MEKRRAPAEAITTDARRGDSLNTISGIYAACSKTVKGSDKDAFRKSLAISPIVRFANSLLIPFMSVKMVLNMAASYAAFLWGLLLSGQRSPTLTPRARAMARRSLADFSVPLIVREIAALDTCCCRAISALEVPFSRSLIFIFVAVVNIFTVAVNKLPERKSFVKKKMPLW
jgi:hypothetical protein